MYTYVKNTAVFKSLNVFYNAPDLCCKHSMIVKREKEPVWISAIYDMHCVQYSNKLRAPSSDTEC